MRIHLTIKMFLLLMLISHDCQPSELKQSDLALVCEVLLIDNLNKPLEELSEKDFSEDQCESVKIRSIDPEKRLLWVKTYLSLSPETMMTNHHMGLFISGKASSIVYLNGQLVGSNGSPALLKADEIPGLIDVVLPLDKGLLKASENELIALFSAHRGFLDLGSPIHGISIGTFQNPTDRILRHYWPSLLPFGVLLLGSLYLIVMANIKQQPLRAYLLPMMACFAAVQLFIEIYRGLVTYSYPFHDWRLLLILLCSLGFGLCLMFYVLSKIKLKQSYQHFFILLVLIISMVVLVSGFDVKNLLAIVLPTFLALLYAGFAWRQGHQGMRLIFTLLLLFLVLIILNAYIFIDTLYYYCVALLIFLLMAEQAIQASISRKQLLTDQARATHLQQVIDQQKIQNSTDQLEIRSAGKVEWVLINNIAYCKGAGDYIELVLLDGQVKLFYGSLSELSLRLPTTFLKTHRSYLVNTTLIKSLERSGSGSGQLQLSYGFNVPVSRRILPKVRESLG